MLINFKMPTIVGILTFMSRINFVLSGVEHEKSFIASGPGVNPALLFYQKYQVIEINVLQVRKRGIERFFPSFISHTVYVCMQEGIDTYFMFVDC